MILLIGLMFIFISLIITFLICLYNNGKDYWSWRNRR